MTIGLAFIGILVVVAMVFISVGILKESEGMVFGGVFILFAAGAFIGIRSDVIEKETRRMACIEQGKEVIEVLGTKVCRL